MQSLWNICRHGNRRQHSPCSRSQRHTEQRARVGSLEACCAISESGAGGSKSNVNEFCSMVATGTPRLTSPMRSEIAESSSYLCVTPHKAAHVVVQSMFTAFTSSQQPKSHDLFFTYPSGSRPNCAQGGIPPPIPGRPYPSMSCSRIAISRRVMGMSSAPGRPGKPP